MPILNSEDLCLCAINDVDSTRFCESKSDTKTVAMKNIVKND